MLDGLAVEVLANEDKFLHTIAIFIVPIALKSRIRGKHLHKFLLWHGGIEGACGFEIELASSLLKEIAHIVLILEIAHPLAADNTLIPMASDKFVKTRQTHRFAAIVYESSDSILFAMIVAMTMWIITLMVVVMAMAMWIMAFFMLVVMLMVAIMLMMVMMVVVLFFDIGFDLLNPGGRGGNIIKVEEFGIKNLRKRHIAVVAVDDFCFGLYRSNNSTDMLALLGRYF